MDKLEIRTLGGFSLRIGNREINDTDCRSRKIWSLLAYLICHQEQPVPQKQLIDLLWGENPHAINPENALRITLYRARVLLEQFSPAAGHDMIQRHKSSYQWVGGGTLDYTRFEALCRNACTDPEQRLESLLDAMELYRGDFLPRQSSEIWVIPVSTYLHDLYLSAAQEAVDLLTERGRISEAIEICRHTISLEPYHEPSCQVLMQLLSGTGDRKAAVAVYEALSRRLFQNFGTSPSEETRAVFRAAAYSPDAQYLTIEQVMGTLQESGSQPGALQCDYDYFRILCFSASRIIARSGSAAHIVLLTLDSPPEKNLSRQSVDRIMCQLGQQIRINLRQGDVFCQCSLSQYAILLFGANYENCQIVCQRFIRAFRRTYPHISAGLDYTIRPLSPGLAWQ